MRAEVHFYIYRPFHGVVGLCVMISLVVPGVVVVVDVVITGGGPATVTLLHYSHWKYDFRYSLSDLSVELLKNKGFLIIYL